MTVVLMLGSAPMAVQATGWSRRPFDHVVAINNAWRLRPDWDFLVHPWDFPADRMPQATPGQQVITEQQFVPAQNGFGGFVYAGGTMAFTAAYWALGTLRPAVIAAFGCDMQYPASGPTHFYGTGTADPLRPDITLRNLEAKSARLMVLAAMQGCAMVNLSLGPSRLVFPRAGQAGLAVQRPMAFNPRAARNALARERALGYQVASGRYWQEIGRFDPAALQALDEMWLAAADPGLAAAG